MGNFIIFLLLLQSITPSEGILRLEIVKNVNGIEIPVSDDLNEFVGSNLSLMCKLKSSQFSHISFNEVSWGKRDENIHFNNLHDLENLAKNNIQRLFQFSNHNDTKFFHSLLQTDSGLYFCMNLKLNLFKIVSINVTKKALRRFGYPAQNPTVLCGDDLFMCNSGTACMNYKYVCDNVADCDDGSDENVYLCGTDACTDKTQCPNGRCCTDAGGSSCCSKSKVTNINTQADFVPFYPDSDGIFLIKGVGYKEDISHVVIIMFIVVFLSITVYCVALYVGRYCKGYGRTRGTERDVHIIREFSEFSLRPPIAIRNPNYPPSYDEAVRSGARSTPVIA